MPYILPKSPSPFRWFNARQWYFHCISNADTAVTHRAPNFVLTHWGQVTHICVSRLTMTGSDNGLSPGRHQTIIWTNAGILLIGPLGTNFSENLVVILTFSFTKMRFKVSSAKWRPFCLDLNVLTCTAKGNTWSMVEHSRFNEMAANFQATFSNLFFLNRQFLIKEQKLYLWTYGSPVVACVWWLKGYLP